MIIDFGKHKGKSVEALPLDYCQWLVNTGSTTGELQEALAARVGIDVDRLEHIKTQVATYKMERDQWQLKYADVAAQLRTLQEEHERLKERHFLKTGKSFTSIMEAIEI